MLKGEVSPKRVAVLARQRGIDFQITPEVESELRRAGATAELLATLREFAPALPSPPKSPQIVVQTSPGAEVYVDDQFRAGQPAGPLGIETPSPAITPCASPSPANGIMSSRSRSPRGRHRACRRRWRIWKPEAHPPVETSPVRRCLSPIPAVAFRC